ncbi:hypothetical protein NPIL_534361 [Nephila pilipes]|uniref:Uncharacterized protein n=1 Tax=Nephila pilipes TaxID=299642 RepID=A0A8X6MXS5_NEPPI|nr:hypothetical protein NPIL_534361 [Nephila pilipes]
MDQLPGLNPRHNSILSSELMVEIIRQKQFKFVAVLCGQAAKVLKAISSTQINDLVPIKKPLECSYEDGNLGNFYQAKLKTKEQKSEEN